MISVFTPSHETSYLPQVYKSLQAQTDPDWEWVVLLNGSAEYQNADPRVRVFRDATGNTKVGYLKHRACELCRGEILFELDHDDELLPTALEETQKAFDGGCDFAYSNTINHDVRTNQAVVWPEFYGWKSRPVTFRGMTCRESVSAPPDPQSISRIHFAPNHLRAWGRDFYWRIGGHDQSMKISDDHDLICRTYCQGRMVHIDKPLYFYRVTGENTWLKNCDEIQTTMWNVHAQYIEAMALKWARDKGLWCIDLCGGINKPAGYESIDKFDGDIICDLDGAWSLPDNMVGVLRAHDAIEHLRSPIHTMNEAHRVLAHGGFMLVQVPASHGVGAHCDPTHCSFWNRRSFRYYTEPAVRRYIEKSGCSSKFQAIRVVDTVRYDDVAYVDAELLAIKRETPRFYGEYFWS